MRVAFICIVSCLLCPGLAQAQGNPLDFTRPGPDAQRQMYYAQMRTEANELLIRWQRAWERDDSARVATFYHDDATYYPPAAPAAQTRASIRDYYAGFLRTVGDAQVRMMDYGTSGDLAYVTVRIVYQIQTTAESRPVARTDLLVLHRRNNRDWLIQTHISREEPEEKP